MSKTLIRVNELSKLYNERSVVNNVSFDVKDHEVLAIIGPNGAGKSTTLEMVLGLRKPSEGMIQFWREDYKSGIGVQLQVTSFFPGLSALENLRLFAAFYKKSLHREEATQLLKQCGLEEVANVDALKLSGGQQKRLSIAISLVHNPVVVFLDEPTAALDPQARRDIHEIVRQLKDKGTSVVITTHDMDEVMKVANRVLLMKEGVIIEAGSPEELCNKYGYASLEEVYLHVTNGGIK
ncbi:ABC transporter ATP-binding protein [Cytobacillus sp. IB215665]|uniref:ABC transporter ATP-binding protein n=1 Tax=Cytobacillus sp. IB215665 TaxID=3097357 RepID=UPI002A0DF680|nr:ABC transporter ATP-binding protein [Cytobacillus sp. IB215665]MDX8364141.1 ABC transporter ATP-binding protein [Cytobacillus sp. IB215665]